MAQYRVREIAARLDGRVVGDGEKIITGVNDLENAASDQLSFLGNSKYIKAAKETAAGVVLVGADVKENFSFTQIRVKDPSRAFSVVTALFAPPPVSWPKTVHPTAVIAADVRVGKDAYIGSHVVVEAGSVIGARCHIGAG
ncbi:MAG: LpxD N-terminal domain-containing protein, partial [bacterium]